MPYGGTSPAQDKKIEDCVSKISGTNKRTGKPYTKSEKIAICKSRIMKKESVPKVLRWVEGFTCNVTESKESDTNLDNGTANHSKPTKCTKIHRPSHHRRQSISLTKLTQTRSMY